MWDGGFKQPMNAPQNAVIVEEGSGGRLFCYHNSPSKEINQMPPAITAGMNRIATMIKETRDWLDRTFEPN